MTSNFDFEARRAAHQRGYSVPLHKRVLAERELTAQPVYLDVSRYVPVGDQLTQDNFQDALEAAFADAVARSASMTDEPSGAYSRRPRFQVRCPEGLWTLTRTIVLPSLPAGNPQTMSVGFSGTDMYGCGLLVDASTFDATDGAIISAGGENGDNYTYNLLFEDFNIQMVGGDNSAALDGILATVSYGLVVRNVHVMNLGSGHTYSDRGYAFKLVDVDSSANNQYPLLDNCWATGCVGAVWAENCLPIRIRDCQFKQNTFVDVYADDSDVTFIGGAVESSTAPTTMPYYMSKGGARVISGWGHQNASGTGAAIGTASGDSVTVTGLSGMTSSDLYRWLYLEKSTGAFASDDKVSGYYLITSIVSATSVTIRKGSSHAATSSLIWQTRSSSNGYVLEMHGMVYHEANIYAGVGSYNTVNGTGSIKLHNCVFANTDFAVESCSAPDKAAAAVEINGVMQATKAVKARTCPSILLLDTVAGNIGDVDEYSREGLIARAYATESSGVTGFVQSSTPAFLRSSSMPGGGARTMCQMHGACAIWDARVSGSFNKSGADITSWTDLLGGVVASLANAAKFPQYAATDAKFNSKPSVTFTGGTAANTCGLVATIPSASWGSYRYLPTIVMVAATPAAAELAVNTTSRMSLNNGTSEMSIQLLENYGIGAQYLGAHSTPGASGDTQYLSTQTPDTAAHVFILGGGGRSGLRLSSERASRLLSNFESAPTAGWTPADSTLRMQDKTVAGNTSTYSSCFIAVFPFGLSYAAREQLKDALSNEFGVTL